MEIFLLTVVGQALHSVSWPLALLILCFCFPYMSNCSAGCTLFFSLLKQNPDKEVPGVFSLSSHPFADRMCAERFRKKQKLNIDQFKAYPLRACLHDTNATCLGTRSSVVMELSITETEELARKLFTRSHILSLRAKYQRLGGRYKSS